MRGTGKGWVQHPCVTLICRLIVGGLFVFASLHKILDPEGFALAVYNYRLLPDDWTNVMAIAMPWIELIAGIAVIFGIGTRGAALILASLLAVFSLALGINLLRGLDIACGCFRSEGERITGLYLLWDLSRFVIAIQILFFDKGRFSVGFPKRERHGA